MAVNWSHNTCSTTDIASETIALRDNDMPFIFFVYVAPMTRIRGMTRKESIATCQQLINAIMMPAKKVEKLATKWPSCRKVNLDTGLTTEIQKPCVTAPYDCEIHYLLSNCILNDTHVVGYSGDDGCSGQVSIKSPYLLVEDWSQKC